jgi:hypothetical protein
MKELEAQNKIIGSSNANMRIPKEANLSKFMKDGLAGYLKDFSMPQKSRNALNKLS